MAGREADASNGSTAQAGCGGAVSRLVLARLSYLARQGRSEPSAREVS